MAITNMWVLPEVADERLEGHRLRDGRRRRRTILCVYTNVYIYIYLFIYLFVYLMYK